MPNWTEAEQLEHFEQIWAQYPKKFGKKMAWSHYKAHVKNKETHKKCCAALKKYIAHVKSEHKNGFKLHYQYGSTWFNNWYVDWVESNGEELTAMPKVPLKKDIIEHMRILQEHPAIQTIEHPGRSHWALGVERLKEANQLYADTHGGTYAIPPIEIDNLLALANGTQA